MTGQPPTNAHELVEKTDQELVELIYKHWNAREIINTAQAELTRRQTDAIRRFNQSSEELIQKQTEAINRFNTASTRLAWIMIGLATASALIAVFQWMQH